MFGFARDQGKKFTEYSQTSFSGIVHYKTSQVAYFKGPLGISRTVCLNCATYSPKKESKTRLM